MFNILFPDKRAVTEDWVRARYADMEADRFIEREKLNMDEETDRQRLDQVWNEAKREDIETVMEALDDAGLITFERRD